LIVINYPAMALKLVWPAAWMICRTLAENCAVGALPAARMRPAQPLSARLGGRQCY
jgi:hypothetical protein